MKAMVVKAAVAMAAVAMMVAAVAPAWACGPYGDPVTMARMDVTYFEHMAEEASRQLDEAVARGDRDAIREAVEALVEARTGAERAREELNAAIEAREAARQAALAQAANP